MAALDYLIRH